MTAKTKAKSKSQTVLNNSVLERFPNPSSSLPYLIDIKCPEFTCLCPKTGQPDFAVIRLRYVPLDFCVELKSLKLYLWSFRDRGCFHEAVTHEIAHTLATLLNPTYLRVVGDFNIRGGVHTAVRVSLGQLPDTLKCEPDPEYQWVQRVPGF